MAVYSAPPSSGVCIQAAHILRDPLGRITCRSDHRGGFDQPTGGYAPPGYGGHRPKALRMRARWCQLCRNAWSSMTNCAVTGAPKLSENGAARSNSSSVNARTAAAASRLFRRKSSSGAALVIPARACLAFSSATTSQVTSVTALPPAIAAAQAGSGDPSVHRKERCGSRSEGGLWLGSSIQPRV
jgi:hypothetical protein